MAELERLLDPLTGQYVSAFDVATVYAALGMTAETLDWLERAIDQRAQPINFLGVDPAFDTLRAEPRFVRILKRLEGRPS